MTLGAGSDESRHPAPRRWTREEYERAGNLGLFGPEERLELIGGEVVEKLTPQGSPHATGINLLVQLLGSIFSGCVVRVQQPLAVAEDSEPEPDVAVVKGCVRDFASEHPHQAELLVEVSDSTLGFDRTTKASLYARAGIPEYWILNLADRVLEVHRDPAPMAEQRFGHHYKSISRHPDGAAVSPLRAPSAMIRVTDLLP